MFIGVPRQKQGTPVVTEGTHLQQPDLAQCTKRKQNDGTWKSKANSSFHIRGTGYYLVYWLVASCFLLMPLIEVTFGILAAKDIETIS